MKSPASIAAPHARSSEPRSVALILTTQVGQDGSNV
jgi:hypothetical protein